MENNRQNWQPFIYGLLISFGLLIGIYLKPIENGLGIRNKFSQIYQIINENYVDTVDVEELETKSLNDMFASLDPHSIYIPASELKAANEPLTGEFEGIGIEFNILDDTIMVVAALAGGPSAELGILSGDRILSADTMNLAGVGITNEKVIKNLRGKSGTEVKIAIYRPSSKQKINYTIKRGTIPIYSVDAQLMLDKTTAYIKISRFAATTKDEFETAFNLLNKNNCVKNLILDLRGNPGGFLDAATDLADEFLDDKKLIVYTQGRIKPREDFVSNNTGVFETGKLIVLIDEGSASASEIVSGAIQDWDRGLIIGRRSFGKGLVQQPFDLSDGSGIRLTVSKYYTPTGRCIQKEYKKNGYQEYENELMNRYQNGELESENSDYIFDTTKYHTKIKGRVVYAGGGIQPDVKVSIDTSHISTFLTEVISAGIFSKFSFDYLDKNRKKIEKRFANETAFEAHFKFDGNLIQQFAGFCIANKIRKPSDAEIVRSSNFIKLQVKAMIARQLWRDNGYFTVLSKEDKIINRALKAFENYESLLSNSKK